MMDFLSWIRHIMYAGILAGSIFFAFCRKFCRCREYESYFETEWSVASQISQNGDT